MMSLELSVKITIMFVSNIYEWGKDENTLAYLACVPILKKKYFMFCGLYFKNITKVNYA